MLAIHTPARTFQNTVLANLSSQCVERLQLRPVAVAAAQRIVSAGDAVRSLLFLETGCVGLGIRMIDGTLIETAMVGIRSVVNGSAMLGDRCSRYEMTVRTPGTGLACSVRNALEEFGRDLDFRQAILGTLQAQVAQSGQIAACNGSHDAEQRLCRWLLHCQDESGVQRVYATQESLGQALGLRRTTVSLVMERLQQKGWIYYKRGQISVAERGALEACACECYQVLRSVSFVQEESKTIAIDSLMRSPVASFQEEGTSADARGRNAEGKRRSDYQVQ